MRLRLREHPSGSRRGCLAAILRLNDASRSARLCRTQLVEKTLDQLQGQSHDVGWAAGDKAEGKTLVLKAAGTGLSTPETAFEIPFEKGFLERAHFKFAFISGAQRGVFGILPEANSGDDSMPAAGEGFEHAACFGRTGGLAKFSAVDLAEGVARENQSPHTASCHGLSFCPGEPKDVGFEGFIGAAARSGRLSLVWRRDDFDLPASFGGELPSARRSAGENDPRAQW